MDEKAKILARISDAIHIAAERCDFESAGTLSALARFIAPLDYQDLAVVCSVFSSAQALGQTALNSANEVQANVESCDDEPPIDGPIVLCLDWPRAGIDQSRLEICEGKDSRTVVKLMEHLSATMGEAVLERLAGIQTGRGPLLSRRPAIDYRLGSGGRTYMNHAVADTGWFVLTHSDRHEKIALIRRIGQRLQLPEGLLSITGDRRQRDSRGGPVVASSMMTWTNPTTQTNSQ
jgi:hypothetical protein